MDGKQLVKQDSKSSDDIQHSPRNLILTSLQETGFIEYMDQGPWYLAFYNDGKKMEQVFVLTTAIGKLPRLLFEFTAYLLKTLVEKVFHYSYKLFHLP